MSVSSLDHPSNAPYEKTGLICIKIYINHRHKLNVAIRPFHFYTHTIAPWGAESPGRSCSFIIETREVQYHLLLLISIYDPINMASFYKEQRLKDNCSTIHKTNPIKEVV